jgi:serine phosphatase RsbU (regulator of sigma subunit)
MIINNIKNYFFVIILIFASNLLFAQNKTDLEKMESQARTVSGAEKLSLYLQLANGYLSIDENKSFIYAIQSRDLAKNSKKAPQEAEALNILGAIYSKRQDFKKAASYYEDELKLREKITDKEKLARVYYNLASVYRKIDEPKKAIRNFETSLKLSKELNLKDMIFNNYESLFGAYYEKGRYKEALESFNNYIAMKDSSFKVEKSKQISVLVSQYEEVKTIKEQTQTELKHQIQQTETLKVETQKKDTLINTLSLENELKEKNLVLQRQVNENQKLQIYILIVGVLGIMIFAFLLFQRYQLKKKTNKELTFKNEQISQQKEEITAQRDEIMDQKNKLEMFNQELQQQKEEITAQRDEIDEKRKIIEHKNLEITQSIQYALRIQQAILPPLQEFQTILPDSFILYKPKDIVAGDFYWLSKVSDQLVLLAVADCTGHGVPGAFMSMIGVQILNEIVSKSEYSLNSQTRPDIILEELNRGIKHALRQSEAEGSTRDGMDIAFCAIDFSKNTISYAGANRPLWLVRADSPEVIEYKATKKAIGGFTEEEQDFEVSQITIQKGDTFYLSSDGYADQFGGDKNRKLMTKNFKNLLVDQYTRNMNDKGVYLDEFFESWKGNYCQLDDVLVVGVRF